MGCTFSQPSLDENGASQPINFKIKPELIPKEEVTKLEMFPTGTGGLGDVWKCTWERKSGTRKIAVKSVRIPQSNDKQVVAKAGQRIRREAYVWINLKHDNVLEFHGIVEGFGLLPALVSPWMENGSLESYLKEITFSKVEALNMLRQIAAGLQYLHGKGVVHGDLTCTNILMDEDRKLYLADFGLSMILTESQNTTFNSCHAGNVRWMAPEMFDMLDPDEVVKPTKAADVYSFGCIMLQLLSGQQPYASLAQAVHVIAARVGGRDPFPDKRITNVENGHKQYSRQCIATDCTSRPTISEIVNFLRAQ